MTVETKREDYARRYWHQYLCGLGVGVLVGTPWPLLALVPGVVGMLLYLSWTAEETR